LELLISINKKAPGQKPEAFFKIYR
jgi:hypothetical protein